jgi:serine/threonine-protein phosphatase PP1 catalytic subunit
MTRPLLEQLKIGCNPSILPKTELLSLCKAAQKVFLSQAMLLELRAPLVICGDIHAQFQALLRIFEQVGYPPTTSYLFLGDYVDRGSEGIRVVCMLLTLKIIYPDHIFLLRGNHECGYINDQFGFYDECVSMYDAEVWRLFSETFNCLPVAAIINHKIFCVHGGISPSLTSLDDIRNLPRPVEVPDDGLMLDLLWTDPDPDGDLWGPNERGASFVYGQRAVHDFLDRFRFDLLVRGHQAVMCGYDFPFGDDRHVITLFSAPNYCGFKNNAAIMRVSATLACSFVIVAGHQQGPQLPARPGTPPRGLKPPVSPPRVVV